MPSINRPNVLNTGSGVGGGSATRWPLAMRLFITRIAISTNSVDLKQKQEGFYEGSAGENGNTWRFEMRFLGGTNWQLNITCTAGPLVGAFNTFSTLTRSNVPLDARGLTWAVEDFDPEIYWDWESELRFYPVPPGIYPQQIA